MVSICSLRLDHNALDTLFFVFMGVVWVTGSYGSNRLAEARRQQVSEMAYKQGRNPWMEETMILTSMLSAKHRILSRRVASLPTELDTWLKRAEADNMLEKNFSQIEVLDHFMRTLCALNEDSLNALDPTGDVDVFLSNALDLTKDVTKSHFIWDFFRDRLELRFVPQFQQPLLMADLISYDCYTKIIDRAKALRIIPNHGFREYPFTGLVTEISPATWPRGRRPPALRNHNLPVPVIDLPWDHLANPWELLTIAHEVGHNVDEDLGKLTEAMIPLIANQLEAATTPTGRIVRWQTWTSEILADLVGILLTGPAFVQALTWLLMLPRHYVRYIDSTGPHPPHYLRAFINTALVRHLGLSRSAYALEAGWKALYGEAGDDFSPYLPEIEPVITTILDTPIAALKDLDGELHSLIELIAFTADDQARIQEAAAKLVAGAPPGKLPIRQVVSASQLAFEQMVQASDTARLATLAQNTQQAIINLAPRGRLPVGLASRRAQKHLDDLARAYLKRPLDDIGIRWPVTKERR